MTQFFHPISLINRAILTGVVVSIVLSSTLVGAGERTRVGLVLGGGGARELRISVFWRSSMNNALS